MIAAIHRNLWQETKKGTFREDLYYRLSVLEISLPPLRKRAEDIPLLIDHFLREMGTTRDILFSDSALDLLQSYRWPGNVRQLKNVVNRAAIFSGGSRVDINLLQSLLPITAPVRKALSLMEVEKLAIQQALDESRGNKMAAARKLGVAYSTLFEKMKKYGLTYKPVFAKNSGDSR